MTSAQINKLHAIHEAHLINSIDFVVFKLVMVKESWKICSNSDQTRSLSNYFANFRINLVVFTPLAHQNQFTKVFTCACDADKQIIEIHS